MLQHKMPVKTILWVTDPWNTLEHAQDTTLRLAQEASNLGVASYWSGSDFILNANKDSFRVVPVGSDFIQNFNATHTPHSLEIIASSFHQIHFRVDPPVDAQYQALLSALSERTGDPSLILNPSLLITQQSEKLPPPDLLHLAPKHCTVTNPSRVSAAFKEFSEDDGFVTKPMNLAQSVGVKQWSRPQNEAEFSKILAGESEDFSRPILVEEFLPGIHAGEVRMWFAMGNFVAALKKYPKSGDFRVLIDEGSKVEPYHLSDEEQAISKEVGASLKRQRIALAAIDFISGKICDYNITSPGLLVQLEAVHQKNLAQTVIENLLNGF